MRSLATADGRYTDAQVVAQLRSGHAAHSSRFDVLDNDLSVIGALATVRSATVEHDVDRKIKGSLSLTMLPDESLLGQFLRRRIRPWYRLQMPDGGIAEWPMGVYPWTRPQRQRGREGNEEWSATLGDQLHLLDLGGPGTGGFSVSAGQRVDSGLRALLARVGLTDGSGIGSIESTFPIATTWSLNSGYDTSGSTTPKTLLDIAAQIHNGAGIYGPWFDLAGVYQATPVPDLGSVAPSFTYATSADSILLGLDTDADLSRFANRVIARTTAPGWFVHEYVADANTLYPGHPAAQASTGIYVDVVMESSTAATVADLRTMAVSELAQRISFDVTTSIPTTLNPAHQAYEVLGVQWDGDSEFDATTRFHERRWSFALPVPGQSSGSPMTHKLNRLYG